MRYSYIANGILGLGILGTSIFSVNQYNEIEHNQQQIKQLNSEISSNKKEINQLNEINTTYEKAIVGYKEKVNKLKINIEIKDKKIKKLDNKLHKVETELHETKSKLNQESNVRQDTVATKSSNQRLNMTITAYQSYCSEGCTGVTATGYDVSNTVTYNGMRIIATDPNVIPLYSIVQIDLKNGQSFKAISLDTGGAIKNQIVDFLVASESEAVKFGRQQAKVTVLRKGK